MNQPLAVNREIEQECAIVANTAVIQVHKFINRLDFVIFALVIEPARPDRRVALAGTPGVTVGMARLQLLILWIAGIDFLDAQESPVRRVGKPFLVAHPPTAGTAIREDNRVGLQTVNNAPCVWIVVIGAAVNLAFLACAAIPAVTAVCTVKPYLKHFAILGHQFLQLVIVIGDILGRAIACLMAIPWREIHAKLDAIFFAGVRQLLDHVALEGRIGHAVIGIFCGPQAEAVMVFAREDHAFHAALYKRAHPLLAIKSSGIE